MTGYARPAREASRLLQPADRAREEALRLARGVVRTSSLLIRGLHRGAWDGLAAGRLERDAAALRALLKRHPTFARHGAVQQAFGEYAEAHLLKGFLDGGAAPSLRRMGVPPEGYLLGLADLTGELRRVLLNRLLADDLPGALSAFESMVNAYEALADAEVPEGILPMRSKLDAARALVERSRGDLVTAKKAKQLENKIEGVGRLLDEAESAPRRRENPKAPDDLDLDAAWGKHAAKNHSRARP